MLILAWASVGTFIIGNPLLFAYIAMHLCTSGLFFLAIVLSDKLNTTNEVTEDEFRAIVISVLGGVGACSPEIYAHHLEQIADNTGHEVNENFREKVTNILKEVPCPLD